MPIYAYKCESCGHAKDVLQKMSDPVLTQCPVCTAPSFKKQVTAAGFQLKGSGWYVTDFKGGQAPVTGVAAGGADSAASGSSGSGSAGSPGDTKSASSSDASLGALAGKPTASSTAATSGSPAASASSQSLSPPPSTSPASGGAGH